MAGRKKPAEIPTAEQVPHDLSAERCILGAVLIGGRAAYERARAIVSADDFFSPAHATVFRAMGRVYDAGGPVEIVSIRGELEQSGELVMVGGPAGLGAMVE